MMMDDAEVAVITYGSVARSARRAVIEAREQNVKAGLLQLITLFPFPRHSVEEVLSQCRVVLVVLSQCRVVLVPEMNMGQISREVNRVNPGTAHVRKYNRIDGQFMTPDEILSQLMKL